MDSQTPPAESTPGDPASAGAGTPAPAAAEPAPPADDTSAAADSDAPDDATADPPATASLPAKPTPKPPTGFVPFKLDAKQLERARKVQPLVAAAAAEHGVDPNLINGVIWAESKFNPRARNPSGAKGLMQLMPRTGKAMAKKVGLPFRPYDPETSIRAGTKLLAILLDRFGGDESLALFGYARGSGAVRKYQNNGGQIPEGVRKFIARVTRARHTFAQLGFPAV